MTMPSRFNCSPRWMSSFSTTAIGESRFYDAGRAGRPTPLGFRCYYWRLVVDLYLGFVGDGANHLIGAGDDLVAFLEACEHLDVGGAGDTGFDFLEDGFSVGHHEDALNLFLLGFFRNRIQLGC